MNGVSESAVHGGWLGRIRETSNGSKMGLLAAPAIAAPFAVAAMGMRRSTADERINSAA